MDRDWSAVLCQVLTSELLHVSPSDHMLSFCHLIVEGVKVSRKGINLICDFVKAELNSVPSTSRVFGCSFLGKIQVYKHKYA